jgi:hypothetical protein
VTDISEIEAMKVTYKSLSALDDDEQHRVLVWLTAKLGLSQTPQAPDTGGSTIDASRIGSVKQFIKAKAPDDDVSRVTALAYHRTHVSGEATFTSADLSRTQVEAAIPRFNVSRAISNSQRSGYITSAGKQGIYQITSMGESLVEAMPDRELMKQVRSQGARRRKTNSTAKRAPKKTAGKAAKKARG